MMRRSAMRKTFLLQLIGEVHCGVVPAKKNIGECRTGGESRFNLNSTPERARMQWDTSVTSAAVVWEITRCQNAITGRSQQRTRRSRCGREKVMEGATESGDKYCRSWHWMCASLVTASLILNVDCRGAFQFARVCRSMSISAR